MSSFVVYEALVVGFKEGIKIGLVWLVLRACLISFKSDHLRAAFATGVLISLLCSAVLFLIPSRPELKEQISNGMHLSFVVFLLASVGVLLNASGIRMFSFFEKIPKSSILVQGVVLFAAVFFFLPDLAGAAVFVKELGMLKEKVALTYASAAAGLVMAVGISVEQTGELRALFFLANLEIGYLTPPVGLNLFLSSRRFKKPVLETTRSVLVFIGLLLVALLVITYVPELSLWLGETLSPG